MKDSLDLSGPFPRPGITDLLAGLHRQTKVMERLADLLPQLIALNQMMLRQLAEQDTDGEPTKYLDGSPVKSQPGR